MLGNQGETAVNRDPAPSDSPEQDYQSLNGSAKLQAKFRCPRTPQAGVRPSPIVNGATYTRTSGTSLAAAAAQRQAPGPAFGLDGGAPLGWRTGIAPAGVIGPSNPADFDAGLVPRLDHLDAAPLSTEQHPVGERPLMCSWITRHRPRAHLLVVAVVDQPFRGLFRLDGYVAVRRHASSCGELLHHLGDDLGRRWLNVMIESAGCVTRARTSC